MIPALHVGDKLVIETLIKATEKETGVTRKEMFGPRRTDRVSGARFIVYYLAQDAGCLSVGSTARHMNVIHRKNIYHGVRRCKELTQYDKAFRRLVERVRVRFTLMVLGEPTE